MSNSERRKPERDVEVGQVLLYDGTCGFCASSVQLILRHDRRGTLRFAALQGVFGRAVRGRHHELDDVDSMVWVESGPGGRSERVLVRSAAALRVAQYLGGRWRLALAAALLPARLRDVAYDWVARHRHHLAAAATTCFTPTPETRARFVD